MSKKRILSLDVGASSVKLAEFTLLKDGSLELLRYGVLPLEMDPANEESRSSFIIPAIASLQSGTGIKAGPVHLSVSGQSVFARYVKLPAVDSQKIYDMVRYEAQQNVPFPIEEVEWDYQILGRSSEEIEVLLVAIKKEILGEIVDAVTRAGFQVDRVDVASMAILNATAKNYADTEGCTLVLDMGARSTNLIFVDGPKVFTRSIPVAGHAITQQIMKEFDLGYEEAEQLKLDSAVVSLGGAYEPLEDEVQEKVSKCVRGVMTRMHMEINRSINFYRGQQGGRAPERILLTGGTSIIPNADNFLAEKLDIPVEYVNPFQAVAVAESIPGENIASDAHRLSEVVGLALRQVSHCPVELDLMPKEVLQERASQRRLPAIFAGMACLLVALVAWGAVVHLQASRAAEDLTRVQDENARLEMLSGQIRAGEEGVRKIRADVDQVAAIAASRGVWAQFLDLVRTHIPAGAWITQIEIGPVRDPEAMSAERSGGPSAPFNPVPAQPAAAVPGQPAAAPEILAIHVKGLFYLDVFMPSHLETCLAGLRASPLVDPNPKKTAILQYPTPKPTDSARGFWFQIVPKQALPK